MISVLAGPYSTSSFHLALVMSSCSMYIYHSSCVVVYLPVLHRLPFHFANSICALTDYQGVVSLLEPLVLVVANYFVQGHV